jgi:mono/diheme cytochrome c family protein
LPTHTKEIDVRRKWIMITAFPLFIVLAGIAMSQFNLSALPEPGKLETYFATKGKHFLVARGSRSVPPVPAHSAAAAAEGDKLYGAECSMCHGMDGRTPTGLGRGLYPRAVDLGAPQVQAYSDAELFWIVKNGIRLSGMPAFGKSESDEHIWSIVQYLRTLNAPETKAAEAE